MHFLQNKTLVDKTTQAAGLETSAKPTRQKRKKNEEKFLKCRLGIFRNESAIN